MQNKIRIICLAFTFMLPAYAFAQSEDREITSLVQAFFDALGKNDSVAYKKFFLKEGYHYFVREGKDSTITVGNLVNGHSRFNPANKWKESMRAKGVKVEIHKNIAMAWVPYDFYRNDAFSHCGIDIFTLMKTRQGWKIAVIAYSAERTGCTEW